MSDDRLSPGRLAEIERQAKEALHASLIEQAWGRKALELVREIRQLWATMTRPRGRGQ